MTFEVEEIFLKSAWDCYPSKHLDEYLVSEVQDPRINGQSILTRALLIDALYPALFNAMITEELRFGAVLTWILWQLKQGSGRYELLDAMELADPIYVPEFVLNPYRWLQDEICPIPDYITAALDPPCRHLSDIALDTFMTIWREQFAQMPSATISVLEVACGSANDYRFLHRCGMARLLAYTGIDIASKNVANARRRYPDADFRRLSILSTDFGDSTYDCVFCHDLLEHLSPAAMERALQEMFRITRHDVVLHFFNAKPSGDHETIPIRKYHRNRVSMEKVTAFFERLGARVTCIEMERWFRKKTGSPGYHNPNAFSLIASIE